MVDPSLLTKASDADSIAGKCREKATSISEAKSKVDKALADLWESHIGDVPSWLKDSANSWQNGFSTLEASLNSIASKCEKKASEWRTTYNNQLLEEEKPKSPPPA
jgi:hypothetical protein